MLAVLWPASWLAFIPVVLIEAAAARRVLRLTARQSLRLSLVANAWSTLVGIPATWLVLVVVEMGLSLAAIGLKVPDWLAWVITGPLVAPWLGPTAQRWQIFAAAAFLCVPFMLVSMRIEAWSAARRSVARDQARRWATWANLLTYFPAIVALTVLAAVEFWRR